jgi:hypothetical protein
MFLADLAGCPTPVRLTPGSHAALPAAPRRRAQPCPGWPSGGEPATGKRTLCVSGPSHAGADRDGQGCDHAGGPRTCHSHGNPTPDAYRCNAGRRKEPRPIVGLPAAVPLAREADRLAVAVRPGNRHNTRAMRRSFGTGSQRCSRFTAKRMNTVHPDAVRVSSLDSADPRENDACGPKVERLEHLPRTHCPGGDLRSAASPNAQDAQPARRNHTAGNRRPEPC